MRCFPIGIPTPPRTEELLYSLCHEAYPRSIWTHSVCFCLWTTAPLQYRFEAYSLHKLPWRNNTYILHLWLYMHYYILYNNSARWLLFFSFLMRKFMVQESYCQLITLIGQWFKIIYFCLNTRVFAFSPRQLSLSLCVSQHEQKFQR